MIVRARLALLSLLVASLLPGCIAESHVPGGPVPLERFCEQFFDAACAPLEGCDCGASAVAECRDEERAICRGYPSDALRQAISEGRVVYDAERAAEILERLRGRGCDGFVATLDWVAADLFDLGGVFVGRGAAGDSCTGLGFELISECAVGSCAPSADGQICRTSVDEGEVCDRTHQCVNLDRRLTGGSIDQLTLRCQTSDGADQGICLAWTPQDGDCVEDAECWTSHCDALCVARGAGQPCLSSRECEPGFYCSGLVCSEGGLPDGEVCDDDLACASNVCLAGRCRPSGCDLF